MSDLPTESAPPGQESQYRRIIIGQEIAPRWRGAWKRALFSYIDRLAQLSGESSEEGDPSL